MPIAHVHVYEEGVLILDLDPNWLEGLLKKTAHPRGGVELIAGGADGTLVTITKKGKIIVVPHYGPGPGPGPEGLGEAVEMVVRGVETLAAAALETEGEGG